jgi:hypothetical protein
VAIEPAQGRGRQQAGLKDMHTLKVILAGFALLAIWMLAGRYIGGSQPAMAKTALVFLPIWLVAVLVNLWVGVARAGYTVAEEAPIAAVVFGVPAAATLAIWFFLK